MKKENIEKLLEKIERRKTGTITDIDGKKRIFTIGKYVTQQASEYSNKIFILQEILTSWREVVKKKNLKLLRLGYYIIGKKPKMYGKWVWGQYCPFITSKDLKKLIKKAKKEGII